MTKDEAIEELVALRRKWKNNGSTNEFHKSKQKLFSVFRLASKNEGRWRMLEVELQQLQQIGQTLERTVELGEILRHFTT